MSDSKKSNNWRYNNNDSSSLGTYSFLNPDFYLDILTNLKCLKNAKSSHSYSCKMYRNDQYNQEGRS